MDMDVKHPLVIEEEGNPLCTTKACNVCMRNGKAPELVLCYDPVTVCEFRRRGGIPDTQMIPEYAAAFEIET